MTKVTADQLISRLRARYGGRADSGYEWAFLTEVPDATGGSARRTADAVAMNLWPSRGLALHGFEVKVSRSDWLRELKRPEKADAIARYMDRWWLVVANDGIVKPGELPDTWGLLVLKGKRLVVEVTAPPREAEPINRKFLAALMRAAMLPGGTTRSERQAVWDEGYVRGIDAAQRNMKHVERERDSYRELIEEFGRATGTYMRTWTRYGGGDSEAKRIGDLLGVIMRGEDLTTRLRRDLDQIEARANAIGVEARKTREAARDLE